MKDIKKTILYLILITTSVKNMDASDYKLVNRLTGYWKFSIGDNVKWADPEFNDTDWDQIYVPSDWEQNGYEDYNGFAWYRKTFQTYSLPEESPVILDLGIIDDVDEVYINGKFIGKTGNFPPAYETAYDLERRYVIPKGTLNFSGNNVIAIKVYDAWGPGGIRSGAIGLYIDADYSLLDIPLNGSWKFKLGNRREWNDPSFDASNWKNIQVPASWESQGYPQYDGYACYRKEVVITDKLKNESKYLVLGRIDDIDEVYFNGQFIGTVYDLKSKYNYRGNGNEHQIKRVYYIPEGLIEYNKKNIITVIVYDGQERGGIYDGPVGIMTGHNYERYKNKHEEPSTFWDYLYEWLVD